MRTRTRTRNILLAAALAALNVIFVSRAIDFAGMYPFERILIGDRFLFSLNLHDNSIPFGSRLVSLQGRSISGDGTAILEERAGDILVEAEIRDRGVSARRVVKKRFNDDLLWLLFILLLLANVHFIWGFWVGTIRSNMSQSRMYSSISMGISLFYFFLIDFLSFMDAFPALMAVIFILGFYILKISYNLSNQKTRGRAVIVLALVAAGIFLFWLLGKPAPALAMSLLLGLLIGCSALSLAKLVVHSFRDRVIYIHKRNIIVSIIMVTGFIAPLALFLAGLHSDLPVPVHFLPVLSITMPLFIGNGLLQYNIFSNRIFKGSGLIKLYINIFLSVGVAFSVYHGLNAGYSLSGGAVFYSVFSLLLFLIMMMKRNLIRKLDNAFFTNRDEYAMSLQTIAELVSSPDDLREKIGKIFGEVRRIVGVNYLRVVFFDDGESRRVEGLENEVEYLSNESSLYFFLRNRREPIFRYSLIQYSYIEEEVYRYMTGRDIVFIIPMMDDREMTGTLLVGDKRSGEFFSDDDIRYMQTLSFQLLQLFTNDTLFQDYLLRTSFEKELDIASYIQIRLFPKSVPEKRGVALSFYNRPYLKVTGDYFDFIDIDRDRTAIIIGDISGHGLAAAMVLSMTSSITNAMLREKKSIERVLKEINHFLNYRYRGIELITLFMSVFNRKTRELHYINAGHCAPLLISRKGGEISRLEGRSKILGADPHAGYFISKQTLDRSDELFLFTDGIIEIFDEARNTGFSESDLVTVLRESAGLEVHDKINRIIDRVNSFGADVLNDDMTLIGMKVL